MSGTSQDTHDSATLAKPPSVAEVDGWEIESSSAIQPTNEELAERLRTDPTPEPAQDEPVPVEPPAPVDEDHDDSPEPQTRVETMERDEDGKFTKKRKLTAKERRDVIQAEINASVREREEVRRALQAEKDALERLRASKASLPETPATQTAATQAETVPGEPDWDQYEADGKSFAQYQKDHTAWLRKVVIAEADAKAMRAADVRITAERERAEAMAAVARQEERLAAAKRKYPDYDEVIEANLSDVPETPFMAAVVRNHPMGFDLLRTLADHPAEAKILSTLPMTRPILDVVRESDDPAPILLYFAQHPEEHSRIAHLDPPRQLLALGRLAAVLSDPGAKIGSPAPTPPITTARPPIRPLGATRSAPGSKDDDDLDFGPEFVRRENEKRLAALRR